MDFFKTLIEDEILHQVDVLFAKKVAPHVSEKGHFFLAYLLKAARQGHLCVHVNPSGIEPTSGKWDLLLLEGARELESFEHERLTHINSCWYLKRNWEAEKQFFNHLNRVKRGQVFPHIEQKDAMRFLEKFSLEKEQVQAILIALASPLSFICGGPGTGKTYTSSCLVKTFIAMTKKSVAVAAPTGKAASNLREALKESACTVSTLHTLLLKPFLSQDLILVDEASMIDLELMASLFAAVKKGARVVLVGDPDQLPPVEAGQLFVDLVAKEKNISWLTKCLRAELTEIIEWASLVKEGKMIPFRNLPERRELISTLLSHVESKEMILSPLRKGPFGVESLNQTFHAHCLKKWDIFPICLQKSDPSQGLFNGQRGWLQKDRAYFQGGKQVLEKLLPPYEYGYVQSVHKSQGSEYETVVVLLPPGAEKFGREMLYTALTRAKKKIEIFANEDVLKEILQKKTFRYSKYLPQ